MIQQSSFSKWKVIFDSWNTIETICNNVVQQVKHLWFNLRFITSKQQR